MMPSEVPTRRDLSCATCGRAARSTDQHVEEWRDRGHRPQIVRELNPLTEIQARSTMQRRPGR